MAEYIDRDAAIAACLDGYADCRDDCAANIRSIPAADVVERKTGKWRRYSPLTDTFECDKCGYQVIDKEFRTNYCPDCGADMIPEPPKEE